MSKKRKSKYYNSFNMPLQHVWNIHDTSNFVWMRKDLEDYSELDQSEEVVLAFANIIREVINRHGVDDEYKAILRLEKQEAIYRARAMEKIGLNGLPNQDLWFRANRIRAEINQRQSGYESGNRMDNFIAVTSKVQGKVISPMEITYDVYYGMNQYYLKLVDREKALMENQRVGS